MDTQNDGLEKVAPFYIWPFLVSMLDFRGVVIGLKFLYEWDQVIPSCGNRSMMHTLSLPRFHVDFLGGTETIAPRDFQTFSDSKKPGATWI